MWAEIVYMSTPKSSTFTLIFPNAWTPSQWKITFGLTSLATSLAISLIAPVSLLTCIIETKSTSSVIFFWKSSMSTLPVLSRFTNSTSNPLFLSSNAELYTLGCSPIDTKIFRVFFLTEPNIAKLLASVAEPVNISLPLSPPKHFSIDCRIFSSVGLFCSPIRCKW